MSLVLTVFGATGAQGGSVVRHVDQRLPGRFRIRAVTRDTKSEKAQQLLKQHPTVELVECNLNNSDRQQLVQAMAGAHAVFAVTNFWDAEIVANPHMEIEQGMAIVDAAVQVGVRYLIWSGLPDTDAESHHRLPVPHFSQKHVVEQYARSQLASSCIVFYGAFYFQNFQSFFLPSTLDDGTMEFALPIERTAKIAMYDVNDTGKVIVGVLSDPARWIGRIVSSTSEELSGEDIAREFAAVTENRTVFRSIQEAEYKQMVPEAMFVEMRDMFLWFQDYGLFGKRVDPWTGKKLLVRDVHLHSFKEWLETSGFSG